MASRLDVSPTQAALESAAATVRREIGMVLAAVDYGQVAEFTRALLEADAIHVAGQGRSGLVGRAFVQRLMHIGLMTHVVGEPTAPAVGPGDVLVAIAASGRTPITLHQARRADEAGARVAVTTQVPDSELAQLGDPVLMIPGTAEGRRPSEQFATTLFCQSVGLVFDSLCLVLQRLLQQTDDQLRARHTNLE
jgi:6-phospho-3-hexuloisomerase